MFSLYFLFKIPIPKLFNKKVVNYPCAAPFQRSNQGFSEALDSCAYNEISLIAAPQDFFPNESQDRAYLEYLVDVIVIQTPLHLFFPLTVKQNYYMLVELVALIRGSIGIQKLTPTYGSEFKCHA